MIKMRMLWLYSKMTLLSAIFQEKYLESASSLFLARGGAITWYAYRRKEIFLQLNICAIIFSTKYFQM